MWFLLLLLLTRAILKNSEGFMFVYTWMFGFMLICVWIDFVDLTWGGWVGYVWYEKSFEMVFL